MKLRVLAFAEAREWLGISEEVIECEPWETPRQILQRVHSTAIPPAEWRVALDLEFADWDAPVREAREMAIIPPVSGG